jgi:hypothetical protein
VSQPQNIYVHPPPTQQPNIIDTVGSNKDNEFLKDTVGKLLTIFGKDSDQRVVDKSNDHELKVLHMVFLLY